MIDMSRRNERNEMKGKNLMQKMKVVLTGLVFITTGCSVGPNYKKPEVSMTVGWSERLENGIGTRAAELTRWWTTFNDPLLNSLVARAVQANLDLRLSEARIREARAVRGV
jgi:outer membrane protein, multidrug efflux system